MSKVTKIRTRGTNLNAPDCNVRVAEHVTINPGPIGELYLVNGLNNCIKVDSGLKSNGNDYF